MPRTTDQTASGQFYSALQTQAQKAVAGILNDTLYPIEYPTQGDFNWYFQNINQVFNLGTFNYISGAVKQGQNAGTVGLGPQGTFANAYTQVLGAIAYSLSSSDAAKLSAAQQKASAQEQTIVSDYEATYGQVSAAQMQAAQTACGASAVQTNVDYVIAYVLGYQWSGAQAANAHPLSYTAMASARNLTTLLPSMPASGTTVVADVSLYLNLLQPVNALKSNVQQGSWMLAQMQAAVMTPSATNGGMLTVDPSTGAVSTEYQLGYTLGSASIASIQNDLANTSRTIALTMQTSSSSGGQLKVSVDGSSQISVGSLLQFTATNDQTYDMSQVSGTSTNASVTITYAGYSLVPISAAEWQAATDVGWFYADPIGEAASNGTNDVTGFKFVTNQPYNLGPVTEGGNFGMLANLLISNYPTVTITYSNANFSEFQQSWSQVTTGNLSLFGVIPLGSFSSGVYQSSYQQGSSNSSFTVTFGPSQQVISVPVLQQTAYVIGGAVVTPGSSSVGRSRRATRQVEDLVHA